MNPNGKAGEILAQAKAKGGLVGKVAEAIVKSAAKKKPSTLAPAPKEALDLDDIPPELLVENRVPLSPELKAKSDARIKAAMEAEKPKLSMSKSVEEKPVKDKALAKDQAKERATLKRDDAKRAKKVSREGLITVASIAEEYGLIPREARGLLRSAKLPKPSCGWAYEAKDPALDKVREVLKAGKQEVKEPAVKKAPAKKSKIEPGAVFTGKAKVKSTATPAPAPSSAKADAAQEAKKLVKAAKVEPTQLPAGKTTPKSKIAKKSS